MSAFDPERLLAECRMERVRGSGPGGQRRNKVQTGVRLTHTPTGVTAAATERREPEANRRLAVFRLRVALALSQRVAWAGPSDLWRRRTPGGRVVLNAEHTDYPAVLAEALDALAAHDWDHQRAATALSVSPTQLVRLLRSTPAALASLNEHRSRAGLPPLR